jgi:L-iditol 2-dehydrogenase
VGICGSDLHWVSDARIGDTGLVQPLVLGHEWAAEIASGPRAGERVAVDPAIACNYCEFCREGNPNLCTDLDFAGLAETDGSLREYMTWPEKLAFSLPASLTAADGAMLEPLGVALHAVDLGKLRPGMIVGVFGCGPIGLLVIQLARIAGAVQIIATDPLPHRMEAARAAGATSSIQANGGDEIAEVLETTRGRGVDAAFEVAGENLAVDTAVAVAKPGGRVILVGIPPEDRTSFSASLARRHGLTIKLSRRMKHTYPRATQLVEQGMVDVRSLVSHVYPLEEYEEAFRVAETREGLKVVVEVSV